MARTKFFRVAVEGPTIDGRTIERAHIQQMADSYDPATYTARINCEHLRGYSPAPPFNAYGSVAEVKAEEVTVNMAGKQEKKLALFASFEVNDQAKELTRADQKIFPSVEIHPNSANTNKAYLVGMAVTDSPASLATEVLKFSARDDKRKDHLLGVDDEGIFIEFDDAADISTEAGAFASMKKFFDSMLSPKQEPAPAVQQPGSPPTQGSSVQKPDQFAHLATAMSEGLDKLAQAFTASNAKQEARMGKLSSDVEELRGLIEKTPRNGYTARPTATGGGDRVRARC